MDKANRLQVEGKLDRAKGRGLRAAGALRGKKGLEAKGLLSEAKGRLKEAAGTTVRKLRTMR